MELFIQRMIDEAKELDARYKKGKKFLDNPPVVLDDTQKELLAKQLEHMSGYYETLTARIAYEKKRRGIN